ncbi:hypothetical protein BH09MYX1_BH09MYX1_02710 [soil metagenome]
MIAKRALVDAEGAVALLPAAFAVHVAAAIPRARCEALTAAVLGARAEWTRDFGGEQYSLGRAFYTHFETARANEYFSDAARSNERVEAIVPGFQGEMRALLARLVSGRAIARRGWCGAGVHVFPPREKVARLGGAVHYDIEGLAADHARARKRAVSLIVMLQTPESGGGLRLHDARYSGAEHATKAEHDAASVAIDYAVGDAVLLDSYRLHQIEGFRGKRDRISATLHGAETSNGVWETWF